MITVRLFAAAKQLAGSDSIQFEIEEPIEVEQLRSLISQAYPSLADLLPFARFAVNSEYVDDSSSVKPGDEIAVIPPVSGG